MQHALSSDAPELLGRYRVARSIKRGGMAEVFEAYLDGDGGFVRRFAIKRPLPGTDLHLLAAFADEARILSQLDHPGIVSVFDFGTHDGWPYQVLEYVDGADLATLAPLAEERGLPLTSAHALQLIGDAAAALDYAHHASDFEGRPLGVVHRDVSPHNIVVSWRGDVKVLDFGIAIAHHRLALTRAGIIKGKLSFMSPEQLSGQRVSPRADVFSLGCVLHHLLVGASPFSGAERGEPRIGRMDPDVADIVRTAVSYDPVRRYAGALQLARACDEALARRGAQRSELAEWLSRLQPRPAFESRLRDSGAVLVEINVQEDAATVADLDRGELEECAPTAREAHPTRDTVVIPMRQFRRLRGDEDPTELADEERPRRIRPLTRAALAGLCMFACLGAMLVTVLLR